MASITTLGAFVTGTAMVGGIWNNKYDLLYNELNGNLDNSNIKSSANVIESKLKFADSGHDHSTSKAINFIGGISTAGANKGDILYYNGTTWATLTSGANATKLTVNFDTYSKLISHFDGASGDTAYIAATGQTSTFVGTAQLDSSQYKFGTTSLLVDGNSDYITLPDSTDWSFGAGDFTVDFWVNFNNTSDTQLLLGQYADNNNCWYLQKANSGNKLAMSFYSAAGGRGYFLLTNNWSPNTLTWYHLAFVRSGSSGFIFINGVSQNVTLITGWGNVGDIAANLTVGAAIFNTGTTYYLNGWIDEVRISKGIARWITDFSVPTSPYGPGLNWK
jgi:hypothetical protein